MTQTPAATKTIFRDARAQLPADAAWSSCFGNPGEGGFVEYFRTPAGERWTLSNGPHDAMAPFSWTCAKVEK